MNITVCNNCGLIRDIHKHADACRQWRNAIENKLGHELVKRYWEIAVYTGNAKRMIK